MVGQSVRLGCARRSTCGQPAASIDARQSDTRRWAQALELTLRVMIWRKTTQSRRRAIHEQYTATTARGRATPQAAQAGAVTQEARLQQD
ncbi:hypothetical protein CBM2592_U40003 [Cupriavidus taiwanensis]|nr:hypothetical protein CBM2592_U40003 [Cupriavidus taiwanensis]SOZ01013.1 hypothetical protein CBM2591_U30003 [Cupriavidus taiwanensis]